MMQSLYSHLTSDERLALDTLYKTNDQDGLDALARRRDGSLDAFLHEQTISNHRAMIKFSETRIQDFVAALKRLEVQAAARPKDEVLKVWIISTQENIAFHRAEKARHEAEIEKLNAEG